MNLKISFCTVCMNRAHHLKRTLLLNITDNSEFENIEFVILDYNSSDDLQDWIHNDCGAYLAKGILKYFRTDAPLFFDRSHSRNMCFRLATGDVLCNVDADNFLGYGFAAYINSVFQNDIAVFLTPDFSQRDVLGRLCVRKADFISVHGYDESMRGYGFEDLELYQRLSRRGVRQLFIGDAAFLQAIRHPNEERLINDPIFEGLHKLYICYHNQWTSALLLLYKDGKCKQAVLRDNEEMHHKIRTKSDRQISENMIVLQSRMQESVWISGVGGIEIRSGTGSSSKFTVIAEHVLCSDSGDKYYEIDDEEFIMNLLLLLSETRNRRTFKRLRKNPDGVNPKGYGRGHVRDSRKGETILS